MSSMSKSKLMQWINYRMRVTLQDARMLVGTLMAFDKHLNVVLADCEEFRRVGSRKKKTEQREEKRALGLLVLRGETIVSMAIEGPPPSGRKLSDTADAGVGSAKAAGRAVPVSAVMAPPSGLTAPVAGLGVPDAAAMTPQAMGRPMMAAPMAFGRGAPPPQMGRGFPAPPGAPAGMMPPGMMPPGMAPPGMMMGRGAPPPMPQFPPRQ